jgi:hypothetical protein
MLRGIESNLTSVQNLNEIPYYRLTFNLIGEELKPDNISVSLLVGLGLFAFCFPLLPLIQLLRNPRWSFNNRFPCSLLSFLLRDLVLLPFLLILRRRCKR